MRKHPLMMASIAAPLLMIALAACGSSESGDGVAGGGGTKATVSGSAEVRTNKNLGAEFAKCMRANGVNVEDPEAGKAPLVVDGPAGSKEHKALEACKQLLPDEGVEEKISPADLAELREYAKCMRANGVEMKDPTADGAVGGPAGGDTTKLEAADKICQSKLPGQQ